MKSCWPVSFRLVLLPELAWAHTARVRGGCLTQEGRGLMRQGSSAGKPGAAERRLYGVLGVLCKGTSEWLAFLVPS